MPTLKNFVAVDWRAGKDQIYFFFKDTNTYSRFDVVSNKIAENYPRDVSEKNWGDFSPYIKHVRFGFTTTGLDPQGALDADILWLFYYADKTPMVCRYDQDLESSKTYPLEQSIWRVLLPYFDRIVAGTWWEALGQKFLFRFIMKDGYSLTFNYLKRRSRHEAITYDTWPELEPYKNNIITAVQWDRTFRDSYYYIFLNDNQYIRYNLQQDKVESGPHAVDDESWPGLLID
ncbi:hypothetical protein ACYZUD_14260 [Pseudomonas sp. XS1P51]